MGSENKLMFRSGKGAASFLSSDYRLDIPCERLNCPVNRLGKCYMASAIRINAAGVCKTGQDLIDMGPVKPPSKVDGD